MILHSVSYMSEWILFFIFTLISLVAGNSIHKATQVKSPAALGHKGAALD